MLELEPLCFSSECPSRALFDQIADKWSMMVLAVLDDEPQRFNAIRRRLQGVTQKALTQCLRLARTQRPDSERGDFTLAGRRSVSGDAAGPHVTGATPGTSQMDTGKTAGGHRSKRGFRQHRWRAEGRGQIANPVTSLTRRERLQEVRYWLAAVRERELGPGILCPTRAILSA